MLNTRPIVPGKTAECLIRNKLQTGKFVHYDPVKAIQDNVPKVQIISAEEYYRRYGTQANQGGWVRTFLPDQQKTIYIKK